MLMRHMKIILVGINLTNFFDPTGPMSRTTVMLILILNFLWLMLREVVIIYGEIYLQAKWSHSHRRVHLVNSLLN